MTPQIGLYYPFIHFRDDDWLKTSVLYWDKMARIVPFDYETGRDSDTVKRLSDELDFILNLNPREWCGPLCAEFSGVITRHADTLRARYGVKSRAQWPIDPITAASAPEGAEPNLAYVFGGKMDDEFVETLVASGLGVRGRGDDLLWVGMHPRLAHIYMSALADQTASDVGFHPLTDETLDHVAMSSWTMERLAQGLLADEAALARSPIGEHEVATRLASIAVETVVPKSLAHVDVRKIIDLRRKRREELTAFQSWIHSFVPDLLEELGEIKSRDALEGHLAAVVERDVSPKLKGFREQLASVGIDAARGALNIKLTPPKLLTAGAVALGLAINPIVAATAGLAVGLFDVVRNARREAAELERESPSAYLMHLEEDLKPRAVLSRVGEQMRRFAVGV